MRLRPVPPVLAALALPGAGLAFTAPAAEARVVVGQSIAGVKLGMTSAQVRAALGKPDRVVYPASEIQGSVKRMDFGLTRVILARGADGGVQLITTTSRKQRTARGVGVGATEARVRSLVPGVRCEGPAVARSCHVGAFLPGRKVTDFLLSRSGRVARISLGYVID